MPGDRESPASGNHPGPIFDLAGRDAHHLPTPIADEMVVVDGVAELVTDFSLTGLKRLYQTRLGHRSERPIDSGQTGAAGSTPDLPVQ
jgi:hypothetical protein